MSLLQKIGSKVGEKLKQYKSGLSDTLYGLKEKAKNASPTTYGAAGSVTGGLVSYASNPEAINLLKDATLYVKDGAESAGLIAGLGILSAAAKKGYNIATGRDARNKMLKDEGIYKARTDLEKQMNSLNKLISDSKNSKQYIDTVQLKKDHEAVTKLYEQVVGSIEAFKNKKVDKIYMPAMKSDGTVDINQNAANIYLIGLKQKKLLDQRVEIKNNKDKAEVLKNQIGKYEKDKSDTYAIMRRYSDAITSAKALQNATKTQSKDLKSYEKNLAKYEKLAEGYEANLKTLRKQFDDLNTNDVKNADRTIENIDKKIQSLNKLKLTGF